MQLHPTQVVKRPIVTEKGTWEGQARNRYSFIVHMQANKRQIRNAIARIYNVRVEAVATQIRKGKFRRTKFGTARTKDWKKAVVRLHADDTIEVF